MLWCVLAAQRSLVSALVVRCLCQGSCQSLCAEVNQRRVDVAHLTYLAKPYAACGDLTGRHDGREQRLPLAYALLNLVSVDWTFRLDMTDDGTALPVRWM